MVSFVFNRAKAGFANGREDWDTNTYKVTLVSSYSPDPDDDFASAFSGQELSGSNFGAGFSGTIRLTLAGNTVTENDTDDQAELDANDVTWSAISAGVACAAVIVRESGSDALTELIAYIDTGGFPITTNGGDLTISWANSGIITLISG